MDFLLKLLNLLGMKRLNRINRGLWTGLGLGLLVGLAQGPEVRACTIGVASGEVTVDGRPLLWKNRDVTPPLRTQELAFFPGDGNGQLARVGVRTTGSENLSMGMNEAGVAMGNSRGDDRGRYITNLILSNHVLAHFRTIEEIEAYLDWQISLPEDHPEALPISACYPFIDAHGGAVMYEMSRSPVPEDGTWVRSYEADNELRKDQDLFGVVPRGNTFHRREDGLDTLDFEDHYLTCRINVQALIQIDAFSARSLYQGHADHGIEVFRFKRYGNSRDIARWWTASAMVVQGVREGEDPRLSTMWVSLGKPSFCVAIPAWVTVSNLPEEMAQGLFWEHAESLYEKDEMEQTQASIIPAESHIFDMVDTVLLPHWRANGIVPVADMERVQHRIARDAYSLLHCLDKVRADNLAPVIGPLEASPGEASRERTFSARAHDPDGEIVAYAWDFGDGHTSTEESPAHLYEAGGTYLVSCTVTDNDGVSMTAWAYLEVE